jgi:2-haloacid dehalogenase
VKGLKALAFDIYGTVVDWRGAIVRQGTTLNASADWPAIADAWRNRYRPTIDRVTRGEIAWAPFDALQRMMLDDVLQAYNVPLSEQERAQLTGVWTRMDAWPDAAAGLERIKRQLIVCALSNGSVWQLVNIAKHAGLPWDLILSVEMFRAYKPDPRVYQGAIELLQCQPEEVMMVATHRYDLDAARGVGMQTAFVARPLEWGAGGPHESVTKGEYDIVATDFVDLAAQLDTSTP